MLPPLVIKVLIGALIGLGLLVSWVGWAIYRDTAAQTTWLPVQGVVEHSSLQRHERAKTRSERAALRWRLELRYRYEVAGNIYTGERYSSSPPTSDAEDGREPSAELTALLERHGTGRPVTVYHSPTDPSDAVLSPSGSANAWVLVVGAVWLLAGLSAAFAFGRRAAR